MIYHGDFVTTEDGTGVVHIAPAFGEDDMNLGKEYNLPFIQHVGMDGVIKPEAGVFAGMNVKPIDDHMITDVEIIKYLAGKNLLFHKEKYEHSYPHCWRCETPLLNYATSSYFVKVSKLKEKALTAAKNINWSPEYIKEGRFGQWLEGARDWSISRQRYWASVIPLWKCDCGETVVVGSVAELKELSGQDINDLHKHVVDKITFKCSQCGGEMRRIPDVLDTWFDSGSMPYAQMHYPFENREKFESNFPAEFIAEGIDQTRCWFYYLHILATAIRGHEAYKNVIVNGIVLAEDGKKMSKRLKNYPDPSFIFDNYSADAMRFYLLSSPVMLAENMNFSETGVKDVLRGVCITLWNVYKFYEMYATEKTYNRKQITENINILDQWIITRLNELINEVTENMNAYNLPKATRPIADFINDFSTWYLRRSRDRFKSDNEKDKNAALQTTEHVLTELSKVMAPFTPFIAEQIWQKVTGYEFNDENKSVHLEAWPKLDNGQQATGNGIIENMAIVRKIVELGLAERDKAGIKVRQPLASLKFPISNFQFPNEYLNLIKDEINVKEVFQIKSDKALFVMLDTELNDELKLEGLKRDLVRQVNMMRKEAGLTIKDKINLYWQSESQLIKNVFTKHGEEVEKDTLSDKIINSLDGADGDKKELKISGETISLLIKKI
jgi:isoleucyl-tRNA synthetase